MSSCGCWRREATAEHNRERWAEGGALREAHVKELVSYSGAHDRVRSERGSANDWPCVDCGATTGPRDWSYTYGAGAGELWGCKDASGYGYRLPYALSPEFYQSRCKTTCHVTYDANAGLSRRAVWGGFLDIAALTKH